jgi:hypothetical protein
LPNTASNTSLTLFEVLRPPPSQHDENQIMRGNVQRKKDAPAASTRTRTPISPTLTEKTGQQFGGFNRKQAFFHSDAVIQEIGIGQAKFTADPAEP